MLYSHMLRYSNTTHLSLGPHGLSLLFNASKHPLYSLSSLIPQLAAAMAEPNKLYEMASPQIRQAAYQISGFPKNFLPRFMKREEPQRLNLELSLQCQTTADEENNGDDVPKLKKVKLECDDQMVESGKVALDSMPIVITRGTDQVQGILYSQNPAKIVCICHAKFFSPGEFVLHAGGGGGGGGGRVVNPLQYITVLTK